MRFSSRATGFFLDASTLHKPRVCVPDHASRSRILWSTSSPSPGSPPPWLGACGRSPPAVTSTSCPSRPPRLPRRSATRPPPAASPTRSRLRFNNCYVTEAARKRSGYAVTHFTLQTCHVFGSNRLRLQKES